MSVVSELTNYGVLLVIWISYVCIILFKIVLR